MGGVLLFGERIQPVRAALLWVTTWIPRWLPDCAAGFARTFLRVAPAFQLQWRQDRNVRGPLADPQRQERLPELAVALLVIATIRC
jgi:hypothetical protein